MTANAEHRIDPLARLGQQIIGAAQIRSDRRRRRRTVLTVSLATMAVGGAVGVAAIQTDLVGPTPTLEQPLFAQHGSDRVDLQVSDGLDKPWRVTVYRNVSNGFCIAAPTSGQRTSRAGCASASIAVDEFGQGEPVTMVMGTIVQTDGSDDTLVVSGIARSDIDELVFPSASGGPAKTPLDGATLQAPAVPTTQTPDGEKDMLTIRPFAVVVTIPSGSKMLQLVGVTHDGAELSTEIHVERSPELP